MNGRWVSLSKALSHALRHQPSAYGLRIDAAGWVRMEDLVAGLAKRSTCGRRLREEDLHELVRRSDKQRFEIEGDRIRARYGHSVQVGLDLEPTDPPIVLYHGTAPEKLETILAEGLRSMGPPVRPPVHRPDHRHRGRTT